MRLRFIHLKCIGRKLLPKLKMLDAARIGPSGSHQACQPVYINGRVEVMFEGSLDLARPQ